MNKIRLDHRVAADGLVISRSQAESFIKLGQVTVDGKVITKPGHLVSEDSSVKLATVDQYVSRAGLKLASVAKILKLDFRDKIVLDVGSSTGGFTDFALKHGSTKVIAVEVGTDQLHPLLHGHSKIELHEKTDIRDFKTTDRIDIIIADVSFISLREILPAMSKLSNKNTMLVVMVKPQFEAGNSNLKHKGVIKNDAMRRQILKDFEAWTTSNHLVIIDKADSDVPGAKGNKERFYLLKVV